MPTSPGLPNSKPGLLPRDSTPPTEEAMLSCVQCYQAFTGPDRQESLRLHEQSEHSSSLAPTAAIVKTPSRPTSPATTPHKRSNSKPKRRREEEYADSKVEDDHDGQNGENGQIQGTRSTSPCETGTGASSHSFIPSSLLATRANTDFENEPATPSSLTALVRRKEPEEEKEGKKENGENSEKDEEEEKGEKEEREENEKVGFDHRSEDMNENEDGFDFLSESDSGVSVRRRKKPRKALKENGSDITTTANGMAAVTPCTKTRKIIEDSRVIDGFGQPRESEIPGDGKPEKNGVDMENTIGSALFITRDIDAEGTAKLPEGTKETKGGYALIMEMLDRDVDGNSNSMSLDSDNWNSNASPSQLIGKEVTKKNEPLHSGESAMEIDSENTLHTSSGIIEAASKPNHDRKLDVSSDLMLHELFSSGDFGADVMVSNIPIYPSVTSSITNSRISSFSSASFARPVQSGSSNQVTPVQSRGATPTPIPSRSSSPPSSLIRMRNREDPTDNGHERGPSAIRRYPLSVSPSSSYELPTPDSFGGVTQLPVDNGIPADDKFLSIINELNRFNDGNSKLESDGDGNLLDSDSLSQPPTLGDAFPTPSSSTSTRKFPKGPRRLSSSSSADIGKKRKLSEEGDLAYMQKPKSSKSTSISKSRPTILRADPDLAEDILRQSSEPDGHDRLSIDSGESDRTKLKIYLPNPDYSGKKKPEPEITSAPLRRVKKEPISPATPLDRSPSPTLPSEAWENVVRKCNYLLDSLFSSLYCTPFVLPVPLTAYFYHELIKNPKDLSSIERSVFAGDYTNLGDFTADVSRIWKNAFDFHGDEGEIVFDAKRMRDLYNTAYENVFKRIDPKSWDQDPNRRVPEEDVDRSTANQKIEFDKSVPLYYVRAIAPDEDKATIRSFSNKARDVFRSFHTALFEHAERAEDEYPNLKRHLSIDGTMSPLPRLYIAKNRTPLESARDDSKAVLAVLTNVELTKSTVNPRLSHMVARCFIVKPIGHRHDMETGNIGAGSDPSMPISWIKVKVIRNLGRIEADVTRTMEEKVLRRVFQTSRLDLFEGDQDYAVNEAFVKAVLGFGGAEEETDPLKRIMARLREDCNLVKVPRNFISSHTENLSTFPQAEGYFKQVYWLEGNDSIVVQTFKEMNLHQRIAEVVCLLKLRGAKNIGEITEVLEDEDGTLIGLSMIRYSQTLKQYLHAHSHHKITAYQKYTLIKEMMSALQVIHQQGFAHRDLSEVNVMVNESETELVEDGSRKPVVYMIDFGKAVFCTERNVRRFWIDGQSDDGQDEVGDDEERSTVDEVVARLPWVKAKPDHGYKMYRSIQTLPRSKADHKVLPKLIHPQKEDVYSMGVIIWKCFSGREPWFGILDSDLKQLRSMVQDDFRITKYIEREIPGEYSRQLVLQCVRAQAEDRKTSTEMVDWLSRPEIKDGLIREWGAGDSEASGVAKANARSARTKRGI